MRFQDINVTWEDSLPKDPRENAELTRLQTGAPQIIPLKHALMENYDMDTVDAEHYIEEIDKDQKMWQSLRALDTSGTGNARPGENNNPAAPPNIDKKGSTSEPHRTGTSNDPDKREDIK